MGVGLLRREDLLISGFGRSEKQTVCPAEQQPSAQLHRPVISGAMLFICCLVALSLERPPCFLGAGMGGGLVLLSPFFSLL